ncbi:MAG: OmpH family outer membrane protein [Elusimicrobiales bacterium]
MKKIIFAALLALVPLKAAALELLLEENRGESGTIGYVDIDRVFKEYSGTTGARDEFIAEIKKKEDALNAKKTYTFTLKAEIAKLRQEREFALTLPSLLETQRSVAEAAAAVQASSQAAVQASTAVPAGVAALPGMDGIDMPGIAKVPVAHFKFSVSTSVPEIDLALQKKEAELKAKEEDLRYSQKQAEKELLDYEGRKSELLLGRIYTALKELAVKEEVSVIVDKRSILFGQNAVDLTGKLLKKLEEPGL